MTYWWFFHQRSWAAEVIVFNILKEPVLQCRAILIILIRCVFQYWQLSVALRISLNAIMWLPSLCVKNQSCSFWITHLFICWYQFLDKSNIVHIVLTTFDRMFYRNLKYANAKQWIESIAATSINNPRKKRENLLVYKSHDKYGCGWKKYSKKLHLKLISYSNKF